MKKFVIDVTTRVIVSIDETKFTKELMQEFNSCISDFGTDEDAFEQHARHVARLAASGIDFDGQHKISFVEGYGYTNEAGIDACIENQVEIDTVAKIGGAV